MGTKNKPGAFDCYSHADPDEPMFVLLGRDRMGCVLVRIWADMREAAGEAPEKVAEARACADAMEVWLRKLGKVPYGSDQDVTLDEMSEREREKSSNLLRDFSHTMTGDEIKFARKSAGLTQWRLAELLGIDEKIVWSLERGLEPILRLLAAVQNNGFNKRE